MSTVDRAEPDQELLAPAGRMAILDHLRELRRRLAIILLIVAVGTVVGYVLYSPVLAILERPFCAVDPRYRFGGEAGRCVLVFSGVLDGFTTRLKIAALAGAVLTAPLWLYQVWAFVTPGLKKTERRYTVTFVLSSSLLFIAGAFVAYEILAKGLSMLLGQGGGEVEALLTVTNYLNFVMLTLVVFGLSFELPLLIIIANLAGVLPSATLRKSQRIAIFAIFVFAGIVVPSTDPVLHVRHGHPDGAALRGSRRHRHPHRPPPRSTGNQATHRRRPRRPDRGNRRTGRAGHRRPLITHHHLKASRLPIRHRHPEVTAPQTFNRIIRPSTIPTHP